VVKMPTFNDSGFKRVLFIGLGAKNKLTEERLRTAFSTIGKEISIMKASSIAIWPTPFTNEKITNEDVAFLAGEGIGLGMYKFASYKTDSNDRDISLETVTFLSDSNQDELKVAFEV
ncbi:hypothetical protein J4G37_55290, partial [Microvirga sp. 3-52]|nr:hypothetical protein [Microvirga sp. 3-52]